MASLTKFCKKCSQHKELSYFTKDKSRGDGLYLYCKNCKRSADTSYRCANPDKFKVYNATYYETHWDECNAKHTAYRMANPDKVRESKIKCYKAKPDYYIAKSTAWACANPDKIQIIGVRCRKKRVEKERIRHKNYRRSNPDKRSALQAKRRAAKMNRTPRWLTEQDLKMIESYYLLARELTDRNSEQYVVDHIMPLQGKEISGLHVPWNLQILTAADNSSKSDKLIIKQ